MVSTTSLPAELGASTDPSTAMSRPSASRIPCTTSSVQGIRDALGRDIAVEGSVEAPSSAGSDVVLTIDRYLTFITERALAEGATAHSAKGAVAIMMDPRTGEILAMASVPTYNPNDPNGAE